MATLDWLTSRPVAHRGLHDDRRGIVENTLPAIQAAVAAGYSIEIDVRCAADEEIMVFHDDQLGRLTEAIGPVGARTGADLAAIPFSADSTLHMPRLSEVLEEIDGRVPLVIEMKGRRGGDGLEERLAALLSGYRGPVAAMSFDPARVQAIHHLAPQLPRGIVSMRYDDPASQRIPAGRRFALRHLLHAGWSRPQFMAYDIRGLPALVPGLLRRLGLPLLTWTVSSAADREKARLCVDQVIFEGFMA